jgi:phage recombination protein Bet
MANNEILPISDESCMKEFGWTKSQFEVIQRTYFKGMNIDEIKIFGHVCKHTGLDPFLKQIYPVMRSGKMTIQTAIDGYRLIAERTGKYSPGRETTFVYKKDGLPLSATAYIKKMTPDGTWHEVAATAYFDEYNPGVGPFWKKMPHTMIAKCAEALALRKAFPAELSGVRTSDEMDQADNSKLPEAIYEDITSKVINDNTVLEKISEEQCNHLLEMLKQVDDICVTNMCKYLNDTYGVQAYKDIPATAYETCVKALQKNIERKQAQAA